MFAQRILNRTQTSEIGVERPPVEQGTDEFTDVAQPLEALTDPVLRGFVQLLEP